MITESFIVCGVESTKIPEVNGAEMLSQRLGVEIRVKPGGQSVS